MFGKVMKMFIPAFMYLVRINCLFCREYIRRVCKRKRDHPMHISP